MQTESLVEKKEIIERAITLNSVAERSYLELAVCVDIIRENNLFLEDGYSSVADWGADILGRSKATMSKLTKVGAWIRSSGFQHEKLDTTYARLYQSINALPEASPDVVLAHASTLSEAEIITTRKSKEAGPHEHRWACTKCDEQHSCQM